jgi:hypothetical protein
MTAIYLRHTNDAAGVKLGEVDLAVLTDPDFDLPTRIGQWGVHLDGVGPVISDWLSATFVYEPGGRGAVFEVLIDPPTDTDE